MSSVCWSKIFPSIWKEAKVLSGGPGKIGTVMEFVRRDGLVETKRCTYISDDMRKIEMETISSEPMGVFYKCSIKLKEVTYDCSTVCSITYYFSEDVNLKMMEEKKSKSHTYV